jgi:hypothetical protein
VSGTCSVLELCSELTMSDPLLLPQLPYAFSVLLPLLTTPTPGARKLLDVEKVMFRTDADGQIMVRG